MQENSQPLEEKQQKLSVGKIEVLLEQNEEEGKLIPESSLRIKSLSYDFDDDIVEYREKNISPDELTSIPTIVTRDCVEKVSCAIINMIIGINEIINLARNG